MSGNGKKLSKTSYRVWRALKSDRKRTGRVRSPRRIRSITQRRELEYLINTLAYTHVLFTRDIMEIALSYLPGSMKMEVFCSVAQGRRDRSFVEKSRENLDSEGIDSILCDMVKRTALRGKVSSGILTRLCSVHDHTGKRLPGGKTTARLEQLAELFDLSRIDIELLLLAHCLAWSRDVEQIFDDLHDHLRIRHSRGTGVVNPLPFSIMTGLPRLSVVSALDSSSSLLRAGILEDDGDIAGDISRFIVGLSKVPIGRKYFGAYRGRTLPMDYYTFGSRHIQALKTIAANRPRGKGPNILLYGRPGTGKTEFARSLGRRLGYRVYEVHNMDREKHDQANVNAFRYRALLACRKTVDPGRSMLIVDEADSLLNNRGLDFFGSPVAEKGQINKLLDESRCPTVWITNRWDGMDESTRRRFDYSVAFERFTLRQRRQIWRRVVRRYHLSRRLSPAVTDRFAETYEVGAGGIDVALRNVAHMSKAPDRHGEMVETIESILKAHTRILGVDRENDCRQSTAPDYTVDILNVTGGIQTAVDTVAAFDEHWRTEAAERGRALNLNLLLYGPPGTGKTEFAGYLARMTHRRLLLKRASDLLSMWVGETEKQIRSAFEEASRDKAILFIDEADSLFRSREAASHSWEVSQVNELLTRMENLRGMLICATNLREIMDPAVMRRFSLKLEFGYVAGKAAEKLYRVFFEKLIDKPVPAGVVSELHALRGLAPGDFNAVHRRFSFMPRDKIDHATVIDALRGEVRLRNDKQDRRMGFR